MFSYDTQVNAGHDVVMTNKWDVTTSITSEFDNCNWQCLTGTLTIVNSTASVF